MNADPMEDPREPGEARTPDSPIRGDSAESCDEPIPSAPGESPDETRMGPAPAVAGADRLRAALRARLFGDEPPSRSPSDDDLQDDDERDRASRSGIISGLDTDPGDAVRRHVDEENEPEVAGRIGRFRVLDRIGRGGMGVVYSAYDPELDRKVAIKLLRADLHRGLAKDDAQARLMREAQAMARLSDPNVIVVHEVGTMGDRVFVAMEYVDGQTLGQWLAAAKDAKGPRTRPTRPAKSTKRGSVDPESGVAEATRPWREVLDVFLKAGSGLAAAHRAGLVHRDFKPDNVLLGHDGRVRVVDFGLARSLGDDAKPKSASSVAKSLREQPELDSLATPLTREGAVMGTPAYMSPEQYHGQPADARSDQFSFCVGLYEGLYGKRPFAGSSLTELVGNVLEGHMRETPGDARVPKRLLTALRRGLSVHPADRFDSMEALLDELRRDPLRKWRWGGVVLGVGMLTSLATLFATAGDDATDACAGLEQELQGVWDDTARQEVTQAIEATELAYAPRVAATTVKLLDDYTDEWVKMAANACGAALVAQGDDTEHRRRRACLDQRLAEVGALVEALRQPDGGMAEAAVKATASLTTGLSACADPRRLAAYDLADGPQARQDLAEAHARLAKAKAIGVLGNYEETVRLATEVVEQAEAADAGPLQALALLTRGTYRERTDEPKQAEADLRAAIDLADRHGDQGTRAQALIMLVYVVGQDHDRYEETLRLGEQARAVLEYIDADPLLLADLDNNLGVAARLDGDHALSLELHRRSHERRVEVLGADHPDIGRSLLNIGIALGGSREHYAESEDYLRQALRSLEQTVGPHHPIVGTALTNLGNCLARQDRMPEALPLQQRALAIFESAFGADHVATLRVVFNVGKILQDEGRHTEAAALLQRGLQARERELGHDDVRLVGWLSHLGRSELELHHIETARALLERSVTLRTRSGDGDLALARDQIRLARTLEATDLARARQLMQQGRQAYVEKIDGDGGLQRTTESSRTWLADIDAWLAEHPETTPNPG
ncbi:serine/threonine-protein kinase [Paraliomyxa miuraensis]|uniref:serine/threonine-protein kinase n=1 Tax=Paraliomyxa miuraensis TaxID=376150 RepID=UPI00225B8F89|nr:serine/threonine-protein kinase [Paraliomyxa miuraensis]MCX4241110.1 serine/threonine-protein kinase [Paraliomyxa miuraensis]